MYAVYQEGNRANVFDSLVEIFDEYYRLEETEYFFNIFHVSGALKMTYGKVWLPKQIKEAFIETNKDLKVYRMDRITLKWVNASLNERTKLWIKKK